MRFMRFIAKTSGQICTPRDWFARWWGLKSGIAVSAPKLGCIWDRPLVILGRHIHGYICRLIGDTIQPENRDSLLASQPESGTNSCKRPGKHRDQPDLNAAEPSSHPTTPVAHPNRTLLKKRRGIAILWPGISGDIQTDISAPIFERKDHTTSPSWA